MSKVSMRNLCLVVVDVGIRGEPELLLLKGGRTYLERMKRRKAVEE